MMYKDVPKIIKEYIQSCDKSFGFKTLSEFKRALNNFQTEEALTERYRTSLSEYFSVEEKTDSTEDRSNVFTFGMRYSEPTEDEYNLYCSKRNVDYKKIGHLKRLFKINHNLIISNFNIEDKYVIENWYKNSSLHVDTKDHYLGLMTEIINLRKTYGHKFEKIHWILDSFTFKDDVENEMTENTVDLLFKIFTKDRIKQLDTYRFQISKSESKKLLKIFGENNHIYWGFDGISSEKNFSWEDELIIEGRNIFDFDALHINEGINWSFDRIETLKEVLDWAYVRTYKLNWGINEINQFKEYLFGSRFWKSSNDYRFSSYLEENNLKSEFSSNESIRWTGELITEFKQLWSWTDLSENNSIKWTDELIEKFVDNIDFKTLSNNENVNWTLELISKYSERLNFKNLQKNISVIWSVELIQEFFDKINFVLLAKYGNLTNGSITFYEKNWEVIDSYEKYARRGYSYVYYSSLWKYLCQNNNIIWNDFLIEKYIDKIPYNFLISENIQIKVDTINKYWNYKRNILVENYWYSRFGNHEKKYKEIYFRDCIKNTLITNLNLDSFKENEIKWWGVLNSFKFLNKSIVKLLIKIK